MVSGFHFLNDNYFFTIIVIFQTKPCWFEFLCAFYGWYVVFVLMLFHSIIWVCWNLYFNLRNQPATINLFLTPNFRPICMKNIVYPTRIIRYNDHHLWFLLLNIIYMVLQCTLKCYADHIYLVRLIWYKSKCNCWINLEGDILFMRWCIMLKMKTTQEML